MSTSTEEDIPPPDVVKAAEKARKILADVGPDEPWLQTARNSLDMFLGWYAEATASAVASG